MLVLEIYFKQKYGTHTWWKTNSLLLSLLWGQFQTDVGAVESWVTVLQTYFDELVQKRHNYWIYISFVLIHLPAVFYLTFHGTRPNAHFEKIQTSNTHSSYMITEFFTRPKHDFTHLGRGDWWLGRTLCRYIYLRANYRVVCYVTGSDAWGTTKFFRLIRRSYQSLLPACQTCHW